MSHLGGWGGGKLGFRFSDCSPASQSFKHPLPLTAQQLSGNPDRERKRDLSFDPAPDSLPNLRTFEPWTGPYPHPPSPWQLCSPHQPSVSLWGGPRPQGHWCCLVEGRLEEVTRHWTAPSWALSWVTQPEEGCQSLRIPCASLWPLSEPWREESGLGRESSQ